MAKAKKIKQLVFTLPNRAGLLSEVSTALARAKVNINVITAYEMDKKAHFMLAIDQNAKAKKALAKFKIKAKDDDVISVEMPNRVGELQIVAEKISDAGININYMYGTIGSGRSAICVFKTSDDRKAIRVINK
jgi:hypothetical protein